jgi:hypothetical protein
MKIHTLTATGVDEKTDLNQIIELTQEFDFMEWGVLFTQNPNSSRYPQMQYIKDNILPLASDINLAAHLCGNMVNLFIEKDEQLLNIISHFNRVQINVATKKMTKTKQEKLFQAIENYQGNLILQENFSNHEFNTSLRQFTHVAYLFDSSGGKGISPDSWPEHLQNVYCGYAGGLSHLNLKNEILNIEKMVNNNSIWLDMEGQIRTSDDYFDLTKIKTAAKIVQEYQKQKLSLNI